MTVEEVWNKVKSDKMFYDSSGGGVTVSGGEPLLAPQFVKELFERCQKEKIGTCVETCGLVSREALLDVLPVTDLFLFDLKHPDPAIHSEYTGQSNDVILKNAAFIIRQGVEILFRQPLIPGVNDTTDHIKAVAGFLQDLGEKALNLQLMPYHGLGQSKYDALNQKYRMADTRTKTREEVDAVKKTYIDHGINCSISQ
jgi:pyruvate formate lyase activating enzyme